MKFGHEIKRFCTAEEASRIAVGLPIPTPHNSSDVTGSGVAEDSKQSNSSFEKIGQAAIIKEALINEIGLAYHAIDCRAKVVLPTTVIVLAQTSYYDDGGFKEALPEESLITKTSIGKWFYDAGHLDMAKLFDPDESYLPSGKFNHIVRKLRVGDPERQSLSFLIDLADMVSEACWENIPDDMNKPTHKQITEHIYTLDTKRELDKKTIGALIVVITTNYPFKGGKPNPKLKKWLPKSER